MFTIFQPNVDAAPPKLVLHAKKLASANGEFDGEQQRKLAREAMIVAVDIQRLDEFFRPIDDVVRGVTFDVSEGGVRLISPERITSPYMSLELTTNHGEALRPTLKILRCRRSSPYFDVAGQIVHQLDASC